MTTNTAAAVHTSGVRTVVASARLRLWFRLQRWLWLAMAVIAIVNSVCTPPPLSGNTGLLFAILLAITALAGLPTAVEGAQARRTALLSGVVIIVLFIGAQIGSRYDFSRGRALSGVDFNVYYLAGKSLGSTPFQRLYYMPTYPDGRMRFTVLVNHQSTWHGMAAREGIGGTMQFNFIYPPFVAILMKPLAKLSFVHAYALWNWAMAALLIVSIWMMMRMFDPTAPHEMYLAATVGVFSFAPVRSVMYLGQVGVLILFLWVAGVYLLRKQRPACSALCFAVATMAKLTPAIVVPVFVLKRRWRWLALYLGWTVLLLVLAIAYAGWENHRIFLTQVLPSMSCGSPGFENRSVMALVQQFYLGGLPLPDQLPARLPGIVCSIGKLISVGLFVWIVVRLQRGSLPGDVTYPATMMALVSLLVSPITWSHHYSLALLPLLYFWCKHTRLEASPQLLYTLALATLVFGTNICLNLLVLIRQPIADLAIAIVQPMLIIMLLLVDGHAQRLQTKPDTA